jgi:leader peptidase (prepilin peptidase) / N-methyltransferase
VLLALAVVAVPAPAAELGRAAAGMVALYGLFLLLALSHPAGLGFGDVKLAGLLGLATAWLGWGTWYVALLAAFVCGGLAGLVLVLSGRAGRRTEIPFGPAMLAGALVAVLWSGPIMTWAGGG